jgi:hypothetical protein
MVADLLKQVAEGLAWETIVESRGGSIKAHRRTGEATGQCVALHYPPRDSAVLPVQAPERSFHFLQGEHLWQR